MLTTSQNELFVSIVDSRVSCIPWVLICSVDENCFNECQCFGTFDESVLMLELMRGPLLRTVLGHQSDLSDSKAIDSDCFPGESVGIPVDFGSAKSCSHPFLRNDCVPQSQCCQQSGFRLQLWKFHSSRAMQRLSRARLRFLIRYLP